MRGGGGGQNYTGKFSRCLVCSDQLRLKYKLKHLFLLSVPPFYLLHSCTCIYILHKILCIYSEYKEHLKCSFLFIALPWNYQIVRYKQPANRHTGYIADNKSLAHVLTLSWNLSLDRVESNINKFPQHVLITCVSSIEMGAYHMSRDIALPANVHSCTKRRLRSACAHADLSLWCPPEDTSDPRLFIACPAKTLIRADAEAPTV